MDIGIPRETFGGENRVALAPLAVENLVRKGHKVYIEEGAGLATNYFDRDYARAGATVVYSAEEAFGRAQVLVKVHRPSPKEDDLLREGQVLFSFLHPAAASLGQVRSLLERGVTAIGYEIIEEDDGERPLVRVFSDIAGQMCLPIAARCLEAASGGRGILLGGAPGVPPAEVVIIGSGNLGRSAARAALGLGASVTLLDIDIKPLRLALRHIHGTVVTATATQGHIEKALSYADVLIVAVSSPGGGRAPLLVTREMVRSMKTGSVIIDTAIDQGGAVETSRPTSHENPTFIDEGVVHYCVSNITASVPRTASRVLSNAALPYVLDIADLGLDRALRTHRALARGVFIHRGYCCKTEIAQLFDIPFKQITELTGGAEDEQ